MKKRVVFRSLVILLATAMLLSSTSAYNILVYANQNSLADALSADENTSEAENTTEPSISVQGGDLQSEDSIYYDESYEEEIELNSEQEKAISVTWQGNGSPQNPYLVESLDHLLAVHPMVQATQDGNIVDTATNKYFKLTTDIDLAPAFEAGNPFVNTGGGAYLLSADHKQSNSAVVYFNFDGDGHTIRLSGDTKVNVGGYSDFALFGYLSAQSKIYDLNFENINVNVNGNNPERVSIISYFNEGTIENCQLINCSITFGSTYTDGATTSLDGYTNYLGVAGAVADNRATVSDVQVKNFTLNFAAGTINDYIGSVVAQNRGDVIRCSVDGLKFHLNNSNHYVGGLVGYNAQTKNITSSRAEVSGIDDQTLNSFTGGGYVGGLVGYNSGNVTDSSVTGSFSSTQKPRAAANNMFINVDNANKDVAYFGGLSGYNDGDISSSTVSDFGAYLESGSANRGLYGGITSVSDNGRIDSCVASGSFAASDLSANSNCYAGGIIATTLSNATGIVNNCYALYKIYNPHLTFSGAVVGYGGNANTATNCYWSDAISGCFTSYVTLRTDASGNNIFYNLESNAGRLVSDNRAVVVKRGTTKNVSASSLTHSFPGSSVSVSVSDGVTVSGSGSDNSVSTSAYTATFSFPAGVGSDYLAQLPVSIGLDVIISSVSGDPDEQNNPLKLTSALAHLLNEVPYGHYALENNIYIGADGWTPATFTGTLNGNGNTVSTETPVFESIIGSREKLPVFDKYVSSPDTDTADRSRGTVRNVDIELVSNISTAVLGTVYNGSVMNVNLLDQGGRAQLSEKYTAAFINCAVGYSYIYGCSTKVNVSFGNSDKLSGFIAYLNDSTVVDNCAVKSIQISTGSEQKDQAAFICDLSTNTQGYVLNSVVSADIDGAVCPLVFGSANGGPTSSRYKNITWSKISYSSSFKDLNNVNHSEIKLWGSTDKTYSSINDTLLSAETKTYSLKIPANVSAFADSQADDFLVSFVSINGTTETELSPSEVTSFELVETAVEGEGTSATFDISLKATASAQVNDSVILRIYHFDTGFVTYVKFTVASSAFDMAADGYFHIYTANDLVTLSKMSHGEDGAIKENYLNKAYILENDISMEEHSELFSPIGSSEAPFTGIFDGNGKTISNLTISGTDNYAALFAAVESDVKTKINGTEKDSGIFNLTITDSNISGGDCVAVVVATASHKFDPDTNAAYYRTVRINNVTVLDSTVTATGANAAIVLASAKDTNVEISGVTLGGEKVGVKVNTGIVSTSFVNSTSSSVVGGIAGIVGSVTDTVSSSSWAGNYVDTALTVNIKDVEIDGLVLGGSAGTENSVANANAGAIVGTMQKYFNNGAYSVPVLNIGAADKENDVTVSSLTLNSAGFAGGLVGLTNAKTAINNVAVSDSSVISSSEQYVGGIAGHIGSVDEDKYGYSSNKTDVKAGLVMYGTITNSTVDNVDIIATVTAPGTHNPTVGGIVGAINGPETGNTLENCVVKNSRAEGIIVGGIVGANISKLLAADNRLHIVNCDVVSSDIVAPECTPKVLLNNTATNYVISSAGVGGILGTNVYSSTAYIPDVYITECDVDADSTITNNINVGTGTTTIYQSATGGIIGSGYQLRATAVGLVLEYNSVSAAITSVADMGITSRQGANSAAQINNATVGCLRMGTGGFVGMLRGLGTNADPASAVDLTTVQIKNSVFDGSITGTDCLGGAIGTVMAANGYNASYQTAIVDFLSNLVLAGKLNSTATTSITHGGIAVGSILMNYQAASASTYLNAPFSSAAGLDAGVNNIYFSSLTNNTTVYPFFGGAGEGTANVAANPIATRYIAKNATNLTRLQNTYINVNTKDSSKTTVQMADVTLDTAVSSEYVNTVWPSWVKPESGSSPFASGLEIPSTAVWKGTNEGIAAVQSSGRDSLTIVPKSNKSITVSIDYEGTISNGSDWEKAVYLPVGFVFSSNATLNLPTATIDGVTYYLISAPDDFQFVYDNLNSNYLLDADITFDDSHYDVNGIYNGGLESIIGFTGKFASDPRDDKVYSINNLKLVAGTIPDNDTDDTNNVKVSALFGQTENASFSDFILSGVESTAAVDYAAALVAVAKGSLSIDNVTVENATVTGAVWSGGIVGGMFNGAVSESVTTPWSITNSKVIGTRSSDSSTTTISGTKGAAGIAVHTDENAGLISGVTVSGCVISQNQGIDEATLAAEKAFDYGAVGIVLAHSGVLGAGSGGTRNTVENCHIVGEIAAGAVMRTYTSNAAGVFATGLYGAAVYSTAPLEISAVDIKGSTIEGNHPCVPKTSASFMNASGGILARADSAKVVHSITDCTLDSETTVKAVLAVGGILGGFEDPTAFTAIQTYAQTVTIDSCHTDAAVVMTGGSRITGVGSTYNYSNMGAGGIIGFFGKNVGITGVNISNCRVGGSVQGVSAIGGVIGAIWSDTGSPLASHFYNSLNLSTMNSHMVENCVVSASLLDPSGANAFTSSNSTTGIVVGHVLDAAQGGTNSKLFVGIAGSLTSTNYPFYNIYYSGYKYPAAKTYLFGVVIPSADSTSALTPTSINYADSNGDKVNDLACYTDYVYDVDYYSEAGASIDPTSHYVILPEQSRVYSTASMEEGNGGVYIIDSRQISTLEFNLSEFTFTTDVETGATFSFNSGCSLDGFTLTDLNNSGSSTTGQLVDVRTDNSQVQLLSGSGGTGYYKLKANLNKTTAFNLVFVYSNGLELVIPFRVDVSGNDYFYTDDNGRKTYFVFNASNLYSTLELAINSGDVIYQCYDIYATAGEEAESLLTQANNYASSVTLAQAYSPELLSSLAASKHPNPYYDGDTDTRLDISILEYLGVADEAEFGEVRLSRLVKTLAQLSYGTFGDKNAPAVYSYKQPNKTENEFPGTYTVVAATGSTGLTGAGEYYSIYGLEINGINVSAQKADPTSVGMFGTLVSGAAVENITFVNPKITGVCSSSADSFAGLVAGKATGARIENITVESYGETRGYVRGARRVNIASVSVGGIVGYADAASTLKNLTVNGIDVVGTSVARALSSSLKNVFVGGIAGSTAAAVNDAAVENSNILVERNATSTNFYVAYAGGIAGSAAADIVAPAVKNSTVRDCECEITTAGDTVNITVSTQQQALTADRTAGVVGYVTASLDITGATVESVTVRALDAAGGIAGEVASDDSIALNITDCNVSDADIRVYGIRNMPANRDMLNAAGGAVGAVRSLASLDVSGCSFEGYVGTLSYDNLNKDCSAGGVIGVITDELASLQNVKVYKAVVSGEVIGYRTGREGMDNHLGAAGGIIGKINSSSTAPLSLTESVVGAEIYLYKSTSGAFVDASFADPSVEASTNVGKIIGALNASTNFASVADLSSSVSGIIFSTYPQDIVAFGNQAFYTNANYTVTDCYEDINKVAQTVTVEDVETTEIVNSFMIGSIEIEDGVSPDYTGDSYSDFAIIPIDKKNNQPGSASRAFRVSYNTLSFGNADDENKGTVVFENTASIVSASDIAGATISIGTASLTDGGNGYYYGTLSVENVTTDIIGDIVLDYSYGLQAAVQFIGMDIVGRGTQTNPFEISRPAHFSVVRALRNAYYIQTADIDLSTQYGYTENGEEPLWADGTGFEPLGTVDAPFLGNYDGQNHVVTNLFISRAGSSNVGLFGYTKDAVISNLHIEIADTMTVYKNAEMTSSVKIVGGVSGKKSVGGLIGNAVNTSVTNCSVVRGNVLGETEVGGLIGTANGVTADSCFTSTTTLAHLAKGSTRNAKSSGALIGAVQNRLIVSGSFTLGYAALDVSDTSEVNFRREGYAGGLVGYVNAAGSVSLTDVYVGATVSDSDKPYKGLTVGGSASNDVTVTNAVISATTGASEDSVDSTGNYTYTVNPVLGSASGAQLSNVSYNSSLIGILGRTSETAAAPAENVSAESLALCTNASGDDYTQAYKSFALGLTLTVSENEVTDRTEVNYNRGGLFYPLTVDGNGIEITSSVLDTSDTVAYPEGMDPDFKGNAGNKNTDLLFKEASGATKVYLNTFNREAGNFRAGERHANGDFFYDVSIPYINVTAEDNGYELYCKVVYPAQRRYGSNDQRTYPVATERQFRALSGEETEGLFSAFNLNSNYILIENIVLGYPLNPITGFTGDLDGKNHTVSGLNISAPGTDNVGLFSTLSVSEISNLHLVVEQIIGGNNTGSLVGAIVTDSEGLTSQAVITNCSAVLAESEDETAPNRGVIGTQNVGGLIGSAAPGNVNAGAGIYGSYTEITVDGYNIVGGLVGYSQMKVDNCYSTGDVNATINATNPDTVRGIGGLIGALAGGTVNASFSSSAVDVSSVEAYNAKGNGVGGLVGHAGVNSGLTTVFSSGSVRYCYGDDTSASELLSCQNAIVGVGGLVGILNSDTSNVYSAASVAAKVGTLGTTASTNSVGIGGVIGITNDSVESAYSSGSTIGETATQANEDGTYEGYNYGVGGVIGLVTSSGSGTNLYFDLNVSVVDDVVGKNNGSVSNAHSRTTEWFTAGSDYSSIIGTYFGGQRGAYPYLVNFFNEDVSLVIRLNALLSIVAIQLNELDATAAAGQGISMAMTIPTGITYDGVTYTYAFAADNSFGDSATSKVDKETNTLTVQRTSNTIEQANFIINIETVGGATEDENGVVYSEVASRPLSRACAQMLGTKLYPYLVATQTDLEHVALGAGASATGLYADWNKALDPNGTVLEGVPVYYRMMGYFDLENYSCENNFSNLENGYVFNGNGYAIRGLEKTLIANLDSGSSITNVNFEKVNFGSGESLIGTLAGTAQLVSIFGSAQGNEVAGLAQTIAQGATAKGCTVSLDYSGEGSKVAGLALTNNGTVEMCAAVLDAAGGQTVSDVAGLVNNNTGLIKNSFTMGDIILNAPTGTVAGFVGTNSGTVENCYTRCNFRVSGADTVPVIGSFVGENTGSVGGSFAAGLFDVRKADGTPAALTSIFAGNSEDGTLTNCMFDKQLSSTCFKDIFLHAASTADIMGFTHGGVYTAAGDGVIEYPQLSAILATASLEDEEVEVEGTTAINARPANMYRVLRSYSKLSATTVSVPNDNYVDRLAVSTVTPITNFRDGDAVEDNEMSRWSVSGVGKISQLGSGQGFESDSSSGEAVLTATARIEDYYGAYTDSRYTDTVNLYVYVADDSSNPNFAGGNGSDGNPYIIAEPDHVAALSYYGNNSSSFFKVEPANGDSISMKDYNWNAYIDVFKGTLNGNGYVISDVTIPAAGNSSLFGKLDGGKIENLGVSGINVTTSSSGASALLAASALNGATVTNSFVIGELNAPTGTHVGGIIGESDGTAKVEGCVVSGKITSSASYVGGVIGYASEGETAVNNCLSTVLILGSENTTAGGVIGAGSASVNNSVFAGNVDAGNAGNITGDSGVTVSSSYFDSQLTMLEEENSSATSATTYYLTKGEDVSTFTGMTRFDEFVGYPVPSAFADDEAYSAEFINNIALASVAVNFTTGVSAGTSTAFTDVDTQSDINSDSTDDITLGVSGENIASYIYVSGNEWVVDTSALPLNLKVNGELTGKLSTSSAKRYVEFILGKVVKSVDYQIIGATGDSVLVLTTGEGDAATGVNGFIPSASSADGVLCSNMVFAYDEETGRYSFTVGAVMPQGYSLGSVKADFYLNNGIVSEDVEAVDNGNGTFTVTVPDTIANFDKVDIKFTAAKDDWGMRDILNLFRSAI